MYMHQCAVGFSAVLFALKVLVNHYDYDPNQTEDQFGWPVPKRLAIWTELLIIQILVPNASFIGHLSGILAGVAFVYWSWPFRGLWNPAITQSTKALIR